MVNGNCEVSVQHCCSKTDYIQQAVAQIKYYLYWQLSRQSVRLQKQRSGDRHPNWVSGGEVGPDLTSSIRGDARSCITKTLELKINKTQLGILKKEKDVKKNINTRKKYYLYLYHLPHPLSLSFCPQLTLLVFTAMTGVSSAFWFFSLQAGPWFYMFWVVFISGVLTGAFILFPLASFKWFGEKNYATNYGLILTAQVSIEDKSSPGQISPKKKSDQAFRYRCSMKDGSRVPDV